MTISTSIVRATAGSTIVVVAAVAATLVICLPASQAAAADPAGPRIVPYGSAGVAGLDAWRLKRTADFFRRTSPSFGDPYYAPRGYYYPRYRRPYPQRYRTSPFRGDPYYDPYARRPASQTPYPRRRAEPRAR